MLKGQTFTQTSECGATRTAIGTKPIPDGDKDGVNDDVDACPSTPTGQSVDAQGCSSSQRDSDNDGVNDAIDQCPNTAGGEVNPVGCALVPPVEKQLSGYTCLLYTSPSPRDLSTSRMPSSA